MQSNADRERELERADGEGKIGMMQRLAGWEWREGVGWSLQKMARKRRRRERLRLSLGSNQDLFTVMSEEV